MLRFLLPLFISFSVNASICLSPEAQKISFWENLTANKIDRYIEGANLEGLDNDVYRNQLVSLSYLELFSTGQKDSSSRLMGYVYANASHHLGRLVRYHYWEKDLTNSLGQRDRALITGGLLGTTVRTFPVMLSRRLMSHSLDLYKTLSWSLTANSLCGQVFVQKLLTHGGQAHFRGLHPSNYQEVFTHLVEAFATTDLAAFMRKFVAFEQTYLQHTMYSKPDIRIPTSLGMLDKMRFIPFNGEKQTSFFEWCEKSKCASTSLDLKKRITFDQLVIDQEISLISAKRLKKTEILDVAFIFADYCREGRIPKNLCPRGINL